MLMGITINFVMAIVSRKIVAIIIPIKIRLAKEKFVLRLLANVLLAKAQISKIIIFINKR